MSSILFSQITNIIRSCSKFKQKAIYEKVVSCNVTFDISDLKPIRGLLLKVNQSSKPPKGKLKGVVFYIVKEIWRWNLKNLCPWFSVFYICVECFYKVSAQDDWYFWNQVSGYWLHFLFIGVDNCGRTVMVVVGRNIPVTLIDMDKVRLVHAKFFANDVDLKIRRIWIWSQDLECEMIVCFWQSSSPGVLHICTYHFSELGVCFFR